MLIKEITAEDLYYNTLEDQVEEYYKNKPVTKLSYSWSSQLEYYPDDED